MNNCVLSLSNGDRSFRNITFKSMQRYADKINCDFIYFIDYKPSDNIFDFLNKNKNLMGRNNNFSYFYKFLLIFQQLQKYDRVLFLDDTCYVKDNCPNLFDNVPKKHIGIFNEGLILDKKSTFTLSKQIHNLKTLTKNINEKYSIKKSDICNTGVILVNKVNEKFFSFEYMKEFFLKGFFNKAYVDQDYFNYLILSKKIEPFYISEKFNKTFEDVQNDCYIRHLTGKYNNQEKMDILKSLTNQ